MVFLFFGGHMKSQDHEVIWKEIIGCVQGEDRSVEKVLDDGWDNAVLIAENTFQAEGKDYVGFEYKEGLKNLVIGISDGEGEIGFEEIDFGYFFSDTEALYLLENGRVIGQYGEVFPGDELKIIRVGESIDYTHNGRSIKRSLGEVSSEYMIGVWIHDSGTQISDIFSSAAAGFDLEWNENNGILYDELTGGFSREASASGDWASGLLKNSIPVGKEGSMDFTVSSEHEIAVGYLNSDNQSIDVSEILYGFYFYEGSVFILENGRWIGDYGNYTIGDHFGISKRENEIIYFWNSEPVKTSSFEYVGLEAGIFLKENEENPINDFNISAPFEERPAPTLENRNCAHSELIVNEELVLNDPFISDSYEVILYNSDEHLRYEFDLGSGSSGFKIEDLPEVLPRRDYQIVTRANGPGGWGLWSEACLISVKDTPPPPDCTSDSEWNSSKEEAYNIDGKLVGRTKTYFDPFGKIVQQQTMNFEDNTMMCVETKYDVYGRKVLTTLPAPIYQDRFCYKENFMQAFDGTAVEYDHTKFDVPNHSNNSTTLTLGEVDQPFPVWHDPSTGQGSLGWYYSNDNSDEPYVAATEFPYSRVEHCDLNPGQIRRSSASHELLKMGNGHENSSYFIPAAGELYYKYGYGRTWETDIEVNDNSEPGDPQFLEFNVSSNAPSRYKVTKNISEDADGNQMVRFIDRDGKLVATCMAGLKNGQVSERQSVEKRFNGQEHLDIHITEGTSGSLNISTAYYFDVYSLRNGQKIHEHISATPSLAPGFYRISRTKQRINGSYSDHHWSYEGVIEYDLSYHSWSINYYDKAGRLISNVPPLGIDLQYEPTISVSELQVEEPIEILDALNESWTVGTSATEIHEISIQGIQPPQDENSQFTVGALLVSTVSTPWDPIGVSKSADQISRKGEASAGIVLSSEFAPIKFKEDHAEGATRSVGQVSDIIILPDDPFDYSYPSGKTTITFTYDCYAVTPDGDVLITSDNKAKAVHKYIPPGSMVHIGGGQQQDAYTPPKWLSFENINLDDIEYEELNHVLGVDVSASYHPHIMDFETSNTATAMKFVITDLMYTEDLWANSIDAMTLLGELRLSVQSITFTDASLYPEHSMETYHEYNSLEQLLQTNSADKGQTKFVYDLSGKLRFSQDAEQELLEEFSYANYDELDRVVETGVYRSSVGNVVFEDQLDDQSIVSSPHISVLDPSILENGDWNPGVSVIKETHYNAYDRPDPGFNHLGFEQSVSYGKVSHAWNDEVHTWYSYDVHGRIEWMIRDYPDIGKKSIEYEYDTQGRLLKMVYQRYVPSEYFAHQYSYNKNNQIKRTLTSEDGLTWMEQAEYDYYIHGPLKRTELAEDLQGIDYIYTSQGLLKAINSPNLGINDPNKFMDPGQDGYTGNFAHDVFGMTLDYFSGDYLRSGTYVNHGAEGNDQHNGLIKSQRWSTRDVLLPSQDQWMYSYDYDEKGQLNSAVFGEYTGSLSHNPSNGIWNPAGGVFYPSSNEDYKVFDIGYDDNGNILSLNRNAYGANVNMDQLTYRYKSGTNQLVSLGDDPMLSGSWPEDIDESQFFYDPVDATTHDYGYNEIGQLVDNRRDGHYFVYNQKGLVKEIYTDPSRTQLMASYHYDDNGFRIKKMIYDTNGNLLTRSYSIRGTSGIVLSTIEEDVVQSSTEVENTLFGLDRLGTHSLGNYSYELKDHLGNVRAMIDRIKTTDGEALLHSYADYYPFGEKMPGRTFASSISSRRGYQGQFAEEDEETGYDQFEARLWDGRIGRWMATDPAGQFYSPYLGMGNSPINGVDPDGRIFHLTGSKWKTNYLLSMLPDAARGAVSVDGNGLVSFDFSSLSGAIQADASVQLLNNLVTADRNYNLNIASSVTGRRLFQRSNGMLFEGSVTVPLNEINPIENWSRTQYAESNHPDSKVLGKHIWSDKYHGQVTIFGTDDLGLQFFEPDLNGGLADKSLGSVVFHELQENYFRTQEGMFRKTWIPTASNNAHSRAIGLEYSFPKGHPAYSIIPGFVNSIKFRKVSRMQF